MNNQTTQPAQTTKTHSKASGGGLSACGHAQAGVPAVWREVKLGEVADVIGGGTPKTSVAEYWNGDIPWLTPRDLTNYKRVYISKGERNITIEGLRKSSARLLPKGAVLLTSRAPIGYLAISRNEVATNQGFKSLVVNSEKLHNVFLYYWLKSNIDYLKSIGTGSTFTEISGSVVKGVSILLPPLPEQKAIAEVLSSLDDKIDLLHRQNKTLEDMAQALFRKWFIDEADEGWEEKRIGEVLDTKLGGTPSTTKSEYWNGDIPWINSGEINKFRIFKPTKYITKLGLEKSATKLLPKGTTVIAITGATLGQISLLEFDCCANQSVVGVIPNEILPREFIYLWIKKTIAELISNQTGGAQQHINKNDVNNALIVIPAKEKLEKNIPTLKNLFDKISVNISQIRTLENLRDTLLPKLMSGEIMVNYKL